MKQVFQHLKSGKTELLELPKPHAPRGHLVIRSRFSLISPGTERMLVEFGRASWLDKARQQPEKVRMVLDKIGTDGLLQTLEAVQSKLEEPLPLGYSNVGAVVEVGADVRGYAVGDRVASNGKHAEFVVVPANLCAKVPNQVNDEAAAFTVLGAIALQGIRLAQPTLGESFVVSGLGLIGLLAVQLLRAQGCRVLGMDFNASRLAVARGYGAETVDLSREQDWQAAALAFSRGRGVDGVLVTASTASDAPIHQAAQMCRKRARIVVVGVTGLNLSRADFYEKELTFQVSCSYGPGRHDPDYEQKGNDYPLGFVRWTEQRNFEAVLDMLAEGKLDVASLISHRFPIESAAQAYEAILGTAPALGVLLDYDNGAAGTEDFTVALTDTGSPRPGSGKRIGVVTAGFIGSGTYAGRVLMPAFKRGGAHLKIAASTTGASAGLAARKHAIELATSDIDSVLQDPELSAVVIATRHDSHAHLVCSALRAGKNVFVEKPLALTIREIAEIQAAHSEADRKGTGSAADQVAHGPLLMVGFNRRFAPQTRKIKSLIATVNEPKSFVMTVNAGTIPPDHWTQDIESGGGRIIGEACHFIDLLRFLAGAPILSTQTTALGGSDRMRALGDRVTFTLSFEDGSFGAVHYLANGHRSFPKERLEVFCSGRVLQLDNFRKLRGYGWPGFTKMNLWRQDKGHDACAAAFIDAIRTGGQSPIPFEEIVEVARVSIEVAEAAR